MEKRFTHPERDDWNKATWKSLNDKGVFKSISRIFDYPGRFPHEDPG
jgi:hypothetical protein